MAHEASFYGCVREWFEENHRCKPTVPNHKFGGNSLLSADVVGWKPAADSTFIIYACELKAFPFPLGSEGRGSVGQAVALQRLVDYVYVGCVSSVSPAAPHWRKVSEQDNYRHLFKLLGIRQPQAFAAYTGALRGVFDWFYGHLGIGLLLVADEDPNGESPDQFHVTEIACAKPSGYRIQPTAGSALAEAIAPRPSRSA